MPPSITDQAAAPKTVIIGVPVMMFGLFVERRRDKVMDAPARK